MFKILGFFILIWATCRAVPATLPASSQDSCGDIPELLWYCINLPHETASPEIQNKCVKPGFMTCDQLTCIFRERGWMIGATVNHTTLSADLEKFTSDSALDWTAALQQAKKTCLMQNVPVNVYNINCLAYDVGFCLIASLIKHAPPATWPSTHHCAPSRQYAETCPECPECVARAYHAQPR